MSSVFVTTQCTLSRPNLAICYQHLTIPPRFSSTNWPIVSGKRNGHPHCPSLSQFCDKKMKILWSVTRYVILPVTFPPKPSDNRAGQAAEAMGAISSTTSIPILREHLSDPNRSVRETCEIALAKINWDNSEEGRKHLATMESPDIIPCVCPFRFLLS